MTGADIKALNTEIRAGREMDDVTFYALANLEKRRIEEKRPWRFRLTEDTSQSSTPSDTYLTQHTLPTRFISFPNRDMLKLVGNPDTTDVNKDWVETKFEKRFEKQSDNGYFVVDIASAKYYLLGRLTRSYTHHLFYIKESPDISATQGWDGCPDSYAKILAFAVAVIDESGMDYDEVNARQAGGNAALCRKIEGSMAAWDDKLIRGTLQV